MKNNLVVDEKMAHKYINISSVGDDINYISFDATTLWYSNDDEFYAWNAVVFK